MNIFPLLQHRFAFFPHLSIISDPFSVAKIPDVLCYLGLSDGINKQFLP